MSRIDEALRRVERIGPERSEPLRPDPAVLDRYQTEGRQPIAARPSPAPAPAAPVAAPASVTPIAAPAPPTPVAAPIAAVPLRRRSENYPIDSVTEAKLVVDGNTPLFLREQYRRLAATLHSLQTERGLKTLVITSAQPDDGKTLTAANVALTLSESYARRVLLIDADLRESSVHKLLGISNTSGLSEAVRFPSRIPAMVNFSPHLTVLTAGQADPNPLATLSSSRMRSLLEDLAGTFDWVLLDAPPVGLLPDGLILARLTGACVLVIRAGSTPYAAVERAVSEIGRESIIGTVLNGVDESDFPSKQYGEYT